MNQDLFAAQIANSVIRLRYHYQIQSFSRSYRQCFVHVAALVQNSVTHLLPNNLPRGLVVFVAESKLEMATIKRFGKTKVHGKLCVVKMIAQIYVLPEAVAHDKTLVMIQNRNHFTPQRPKERMQVLGEQLVKKPTVKSKLS